MYRSGTCKKPSLLIVTWDLSAGLQLDIGYYQALIIIIHFTISFQSGHQLEWLAPACQIDCLKSPPDQVNISPPPLSYQASKDEMSFSWHHCSQQLGIMFEGWALGAWTRSGPRKCPSKYPNSCPLSRTARGDKVKDKTVRQTFKLHPSPHVSLLGVQMEARQMSILPLIFESLLRMHCIGENSNQTFVVKP